ncbi:TPR domain-containing glycosyltransferase [Venenivibrio stagnispumantis]|uniref:Glycosyltransferase involved in cell wall bisynthesis n=1 Tax=Venenivibrio stagnispumantis TaxID=407998 RepID=A0AA46ACK5_9AQUI|nr:TPR domain-containing glycosyltransferase [Venenivibrio stagnispumantis]MCW4572737.1 glycosyltransferase [Venenivibrio stagnispumantis]SMP00228.1 Glycosyltransferase involved in cell wall bisynthesis [Venenivibrio stagnispumantis]
MKEKLFPTVSACIIAKNEEKNLPRLLESLKGKFDEIVLVDTGSTDKTIEIAKSYGAKVYQKEWKGFGDARQFAVDKATSDWIWFFDADMELEEEEYKKFQLIINQIHKDENIEGLRVYYKNMTPYGKIQSISTTVHIHRNKPYLKWVGKIHERVVNINTNTIVVPQYQIFVRHYGYSDASTQKEKAKRNLNLLFEELKETEKNSYDYFINLFYIVQSYTTLSAFDKFYLKEVIKYAQQFFEEINPQDYKNTIFYKHIFVYTIKAYFELDDLENAKKYLNKFLEELGDYPDIIYLKAMIEEKENKIEDSIETFLYFVYLSDKIKQLGILENVISDYIININYVIYEKIDKYSSKKELLEMAERYWKETKGKNTALVYYLIQKEIDKEKAEKLLDKFIKLYQDDDRFFIELAKNKEDIEEQIKILEEAKIINPDNPDINLNLGKLYFKKEDYEKAFYNLKNYLEVSKDSSVIPLLKESIEKLGFSELSKNLTEKLKNF